MLNFAHFFDPKLEETDDQLPPMAEGGSAQELMKLIQLDGIVRMEHLRQICKPGEWGDHILGEIEA